GRVSDTQLIVTAQPPPDVSVGSPFGLMVTAKYATGVIDTAFNGSVTVALANNPTGATLGGTVTAMASQGVVTFNGLTVDKAARGYPRTAPPPGTPPRPLPNPLNVGVGPATKLVVTTEPPGTVTAGSPFSVVVTDEYVSGPVAATFNGPVTIALVN